MLTPDTDALLEAYVLDRLPPAERAAVERRLASDAAWQAVRDRIEQTLADLALAQAVAPPAALRRRTLEAVSAAIAADQAVVKAAQATTGRTLQLTPTQWLVAASLAMAVVAVGGLLYTGQRLAALEARLSDVQTQNGNLALTLQRTAVVTGNLQTEVRLTHAGFVRVDLNTAPGAPGGSAVVYWSAARGETYFVGQLPPVPEGKQYQLWALHNGQPIDAGLLGIAPNGILEPMKKIPKAEAFAVSLEPVGGSANPTTQAIMVVGAVKKDNS